MGGAEISLRAMWPLIFSREEPIRTAVVDAWHNLYLNDRTPVGEQAKRLVGLVGGATLGEIKSLDETLKHLGQARSTFRQTAFSLHAHDTKACM